MVRNNNKFNLQALCGPDYESVLKSLKPGQLDSAVASIAKNGVYHVDGQARQVNKEEAKKRMANLHQRSINAGHCEIGPDLLPRRRSS